MSQTWYNETNMYYEWYSGGQCARDQTGEV